MPTLCLKYDKVPQPYLKHSSNMTEKLNSIEFHFKNSVSQKLGVIEQF